MAGKKAKDEWGSKWFFTVNAPTLTSLLLTCTTSDMPVEVLAYKIGYEVGKTGNLHKHMYFSFARSWRKSALISRFKGAEIIRITPGTEQTVIAYICGDEKAGEKGSINLWSDVYGDLDGSQGKRNDVSATDAALWQIKDAIDEGASMRDLYTSFFPYVIRYGRGVRDYHEFVRSSINGDATAMYTVKNGGSPIKDEGGVENVSS